MWVVLKTLLQEEIHRLWRRLLRKPDPPTSFAGYRDHRGPAEPGSSPDSPDSRSAS